MSFGALMDRIAARGSPAASRPRHAAGALVLGLLCPTCRARTAGRSPSTRPAPARRRCSTCCPGRGGTPTRSAMTCAATWSTQLGDPRRGAGGRRDRRSEEGHRARSGCTPVHRHRRADRERPGRGVFWPTPPPHGHALIDRRLYLPQILDRATRSGCAAAGVPDGHRVRRPSRRWPREMITRALDAGVPARWVTGDEVYGDDPGLRATAARNAASATCWPSPATTASATDAGSQSAPTSWPRDLPARAWQRRRAGPGAKGQRWYDWAWIAHRPQPTDAGQHRSADPPQPPHR